MNKLIVFITGLPGTGKSYAARLICEHFPQFRQVSFDRIKEMFWDTYGFDSHQEKTVLNDRALEHFYQYLDEQMRCYSALLAEYPFHQRHRDTLASLVSNNGFKAITVCLDGQLEAIYQRQKFRDDNDPRHPGHLGDVYHKEEYERYLNGPHYNYTLEEFWKLHEGRDYHIHIGKEIDIDVTDLSSVSYNAVVREIEDILKEQ